MLRTWGSTVGTKHDRTQDPAFTKSWNRRASWLVGVDCHVKGEGNGSIRGSTQICKMTPLHWKAPTLEGSAILPGHLIWLMNGVYSEDISARENRHAGQPATLGYHLHPTQLDTDIARLCVACRLPIVQDPCWLCRFALGMHSSTI